MILCHAKFEIWNLKFAWLVTVVYVGGLQMDGFSQVVKLWWGESVHSKATLSSFGNYVTSIIMCNLYYIIVYDKWPVRWNQLKPIYNSIHNILPGTYWQDFYAWHVDYLGVFPVTCEMWHMHHKSYLISFGFWFYLL